MCHHIVVALALMVGGDGTASEVMDYVEPPCVLAAHGMDDVSPFAASSYQDPSRPSSSAAPRTYHARGGDPMLLAPPMSFPESASTAADRHAQ